MWVWSHEEIFLFSIIASLSTSLCDTMPKDYNFKVVYALDFKDGRNQWAFSPRSASREKLKSEEMRFKNIFAGGPDVLNNKLIQLA